MTVPFATLPFPFLDFVVVSFSAPDAAERALHNLRSDGTLKAFEFQTCENQGQPTTIIGGPSGRLSGNGKPTRLLFSGLALEDGCRLRIGHEEAERLLSGVVRPPIGQCSFAVVRRDGVRLCTDLFGHGLVFASQLDDFAVASNRSHLHALVLRCLGHSLKLNTEVAALFMVGNSPLLSQQASTSATLMRGIDLVRADEKITLISGRILRERNHDFVRLFYRPASEYERLLVDGIDELIQGCSAVINDHRFSKIIIDLSGGKDSRMVFGAMLQHPHWHERCRLHVNDTPNSDDLKIACGIANLFGAEFDDGTPVPMTPRSEKDNLDFWRSYFHGQYHRMAAGPWSHLGKNLSTVNLSGGNGEVMRGFWSTIFRDTLNGADSLEDLCRRIITKCSSGAQNVNHQRADYVFHREMASLPGATAADRLDLHYTCFRNRTHFGMRGFSFMSNQLTLFPLLSPSLVAASWSLPAEERRGSRSITDILQRLHPALAAIPFDSGERLSADTFNTDQDTTRWRAAKERKIELFKQARTSKPAMSWREWPNYVIGEAKSCADRLRDLGVSMNFSSIDDTANQRLALETASKILAMHDAIYP